MRHKLHLILMMAFMAALTLPGCENDETTLPPKKPELRLSIISDISAQGGAFALDYTLENPLEDATEKVTASCDASWIKITSIEKDQIRFTVEKYIYKEGIEDRTTEITVNYANLQKKASLKQLCPEKSAEVSVPKLTLATLEDIPATGGKFYLKYTLENPVKEQSVKVSASCNASWVKISSVEEDKILFTVEEYFYKEEIEDRMTEIAVTYADLKETAPLKQIRPQKPQPAEPTFQIKILEVTPSTAKARCTPSDLETSYVFREMRKAHYEEFANDHALIEDDIKRFRQEDWYGNVGQISDHLVSGVQDDTFFISDSEPYYIIAYGLTADGTITSTTITKVEIIGLPRPVLTADWDNSRILPLEGGIFEVHYALENPIPGAEVTINPPRNTEWVHDFMIGENTITFTVDKNTTSEPGDAPRESYFTIDYPEVKECIAIIIKQEAPAAEMNFNIELVSLRPSEIKARCMPSDLSATYVFREINRQKYEQFASDTDLIQDDIFTFRQEDWYGNIGQISDHLVSGVQENTFYTNGFDKEYYIIAYGLKDDGTVTTTKISKILCTLPENPVITTDWDNNLLIPVEGGIYTINYTIKNPLAECDITADKQWGADWIEILSVTSSQITFKVSENIEATEDGLPRSSFISITYPDAISNAIAIVKQASPIKQK